MNELECEQANGNDFVNLKSFITQSNRLSCGDFPDYFAKFVRIPLRHTFGCETTPPPLLLFTFLSPSLAPTHLTLSLVSFHRNDRGRLFFHATLDAESLDEGFHELELELFVLNVGLIQTDAHRHRVEGVKDDVATLLGLVLRNK